MILIGITGKIGSGKSTFCSYFKKLGSAVIIADEIGNKLLNESRIKIKIERIFGKSVFKRNNFLDKQKLANLVFNDRAKLEKLNKIIHPEVIKQIETQINLIKTNKLVLVESAILQNTNLKNRCDFIVSIKSDLKNRISRKLNEKISAKEVILRSKNQPSEKEYEKYSDLVIVNNGTKKEFIDKIKISYKLFAQLAGNRK